MRESAPRDGHALTSEHSLAAEPLVPGDVVLLDAGERVPADLRLLEVRDLRIEEAALTDESLPVDKQIAPVAALVSLGDRRRMALVGLAVAAITEGVGYVPHGGIHCDDGQLCSLDSADNLREMARAGLLAINASLALSDQRWQVSGDPTEAALLTLAGKRGLQLVQESRDRRRVGYP